MTNYTTGEGRSFEEYLRKDPRRTSIMRIQHYVDGELSGGEVTVLEQHIVECTDCEEEVRMEILVKRLVHRSCAGETAPQGLREKVAARLGRGTFGQGPKPF
ncbi:mycothiol system anti-sigma-R factor [Brevibacterium samyangense]|uniref:Putative zinc-finger domain-containing protein n=1 Tax=Brevibacterium samyangense TaxID=366888 RepID=A0ABN2TAG7_9MICO